MIHLNVKSTICNENNFFFPLCNKVDTILFYFSCVHTVYPGGVCHASGELLMSRRRKTGASRKPTDLVIAYENVIAPDDGKSVTTPRRIRSSAYFSRSYTDMSRYDDRTVNGCNRCVRP
uniref:Uncharacterized protein n=1 Tax=Sipha flava TaxID=143950 RepID=A0A2S2RAF6_9HEMI